MQKKFYDVQSINVSEKLQKYSMSEKWSLRPWNKTTLDRRQSKTLILLTNIDQKLLKTETMILY